MVRVRNLFRSDSSIRLLSWIASLYIRLIFITCRWNTVGKSIPEEYLKAQKPFIVCFWHGRLGMLACAWVWESRPFEMLLSAHRDGRFIGQTVGHFGIQSIWGSTKRGGTEALRVMIQRLKAGATIGITPDGPKGPNQHASPGIIALASMAQVDIIPITYSTSRKVHLKTWDRFLLPLPFGQGVFLWGDPISAPLNRNPETMEALRIHLEEKMTELQNRADEVVKYSDSMP